MNQATKYWQSCFDSRLSRGWHSGKAPTGLAGDHPYGNNKAIQILPICHMVPSLEIFLGWVDYVWVRDKYLGKELLFLVKYM